MDPSLLAVFYDYIKLMPMVAEANQMSQELNKVISHRRCAVLQDSSLRQPSFNYNNTDTFLGSKVSSCSYCLPLFQGVEFKLEIKNLALSDSKGHDLQKDIVVRVTSKGNKQVSLTPSFTISFFCVALVAFMSSGG